MSASPWPRYPPCSVFPCTDPICCAQGYKFRWPELVGKPGNQAQAIIQKDNPIVTVVILPTGSAITGDFCCNRVRLFLNDSGNVAKVPHVG